MSYRKFRADQLFTGYQLLDKDTVLITDEQGVVESILPYAEAGDEVEYFPGILSPGFINCHCHLELSHMKGAIPEKSGMTDFVLAVVQQRHHPDENILAAIEEAENDMLQNGIVAVGDICNNTLTLPQKKKGRLYYHNFIEASGFVPSIAEQRFARSLEFFNAYAQQYALPIESNSIVPHAPYSVSPELFKRIIHFPGNHILTMHNQESIAEEELFIHNKGDFQRMFEGMKIDISFFQPSGKNSLQTVLPYFLRNQTLILVHNVTTSEKDITYLKKVGSSSPDSPLPLKLQGAKPTLPSAEASEGKPDLFFCICPNANLFIGNGLPDIDLLIKSNIPIVMGTDSLASNRQLSILEEIKTLQHHFPKLDLLQLLQWATINGARALQLEEMLGSFEKGKRPGVLLIKEGPVDGIGGSSKVERLL